MNKNSAKIHSLIGIDQMLKSVKKVLISGIGGGGDVLTALHVRWALEKLAPDIKWVQGGVTGSDINHFEQIEKVDESSAWISAKSKSKPPHRLIEAIIAKKLEKMFLLSCHHGVKNMIKSLNSLIESESIEMALFLDGGTDILSFFGSAVVSPVEDTMGLAAVGLGDYSNHLKYRVAGVSVVGSDGEMTLDEIGSQLLKIYGAGGYVGGTFFPAERLLEYAQIITEVLQHYPTATALAPLLVTETPFENPLFFPLTNGFQLATFLFDAKIAAKVGNDFTSLILDKPSRQAAKEAIITAMTQHRSKEKK